MGLITILVTDLSSTSSSNNQKMKKAKYTDLFMINIIKRKLKYQDHGYQKSQ